jgi:uncharacterized protein YbjQ (UPF0145 family)
MTVTTTTAIDSPPVTEYVGVVTGEAISLRRPNRANRASL